MQVGQSHFTVLNIMLRKNFGEFRKCFSSIFIFLSAITSKFRLKHESNLSLLYVPHLLQILGLEICADTMIGDEMLRGISGGQRKRVTTGKI
jgi:hypothetical protein